MNWDQVGQVGHGISTALIVVNFVKIKTILFIASENMYTVPDQTSPLGTDLDYQAPR